MRQFILLLVLAIAYEAEGQSHDDQVFAYSQVMTNCVGQQFTDQQTTRIVTAVRRCEQIAVQPLRDRALEQVIADIQNPLGGGRVVYVPVAVNPATLGGLGGVGGVSPFPFNSLAAAGQPFGTSGFGGIPGRQPGFNQFNTLNSLNSLDNNNFRRPDSTFAPTNTFGQAVTNRPTNRASNPFGLFGKQTTEGESSAVVSEQVSQKLTQDEDKPLPLKRTTRQTATDRFARAEALYYLSNMTCVMREAGLIDHNNLPNYQFVENELRRTQLSRELRNDLASGLLFCKELTQCMPVERLNHPLARELGQAIAYYRCLARTNVKACRKQEERRTQGSARLTGAFNFFNGNGRDLLRSVTELALSDDALGFDFF